jgi:hypothetical protein
MLDVAVIYIVNSQKRWIKTCYYDTKENAGAKKKNKGGIKLG